MRWAVGVTTVRERSESLMRTLQSLAAAGFAEVRVYEDSERLGCVANWWLTACQLLVRSADRYAIFQDDVVCVRGLRAYLEAQRLESRTYWNLYASPPSRQKGESQTWPPSKQCGWFPSSQCCRGALALVFDRAGLETAVFSQHMRSALTYRTAADAAVCESLSRGAGYLELIHSPSLVQHMDEPSTVGHASLRSLDFPGEDFDAMGLLYDDRAGEARSAPAVASLPG